MLLLSFVSMGQTVMASVIPKWCIKCINILVTDQKATNWCTHLHCLYTMHPDAKHASADKGSNATKTN